jgi:hypothetical protein
MEAVSLDSICKYGVHRVDTTTVKPTTPQPNGIYGNPTVLRMDIAIGVDFYATNSNFYPTVSIRS